MCVLTVSAGDGADRGEQLLRRVVLEDEAARAGAEGRVDVLVEVERRQDQDPRASAARIRRVGLGEAGRVRPRARLSTGPNLHLLGSFPVSAARRRTAA
jgi:hypothetical protein